MHIRQSLSTKQTVSLFQIEALKKRKKTLYIIHMVITKGKKKKVELYNPQKNIERMTVNDL